MNAAYCRKSAKYQLALVFDEIPGSGVSVPGLLFIDYFNCAPLGFFCFFKAIPTNLVF